VNKVLDGITELKYTEKVAWNESSLPLKSILQNTQTLPLFTMIVKTEITYKSYKKCQAGELGCRDLAA
jgi:hypothetical protein